MNRINQLTKIHLSGKPYIIYKSKKGFNLYTNFSKKIILNNKNIKSFLTKKNKKQSTNTDLFIGFFGYELLNNLIDVKVPKQKNLNFPKGIFYKPEKKIKLSNKLNYDSKNFECGNFKININRKNYTKIFNKFKKKIKSGEVKLKINFLDKNLSKYQGFINAKKFRVINAPKIVKSLSVRTFFTASASKSTKSSPVGEALALLPITPAFAVGCSIPRNNGTSAS